MSNIIAENLSIKFRIYHDRSPSLKDYFASLLRGGNPSAYSDFWAVKEVSFQIKPGERVGIVGHNGAGKSTLLKALCRIYEPSDGRILVNGRIAPLLEIGAGFHPEFTGRENIFLNGAILGYSHDQLKAIAPEVIAFADLEEFIDTAVKYYSTGMYMRLAFSLATAMHPDILILDEIFAGGDASFVAKARARMHELIDKANIMIMVSHDHELVRSLCNRVIWLDHGRLVADGAPDHVLQQYLSAGAATVKTTNPNRKELHAASPQI
jgi:ABC-type polysaccharide/polyol phosphate transport system ATPase subunit